MALTSIVLVSVKQSLWNGVRINEMMFCILVSCISILTFCVLFLVHRTQSHDCLKIFAWLLWSPALPWACTVSHASYFIFRLGVPALYLKTKLHAQQILLFFLVGFWEQASSLFSLWNYHCSRCVYFSLSLQHWVEHSWNWT